jgi:hypothetical protein
MWYSQIKIKYNVNCILIVVIINCYELVRVNANGINNLTKINEEIKLN